MTTDATPKAGLEDVVAATSAICYLDGDRGVLAYYGYDIHDLARGASFEEVCYLLWHGRLPNRAELGDLQSQLAAARPLSEPILRLMKQLPPSDGMDMLRTLTSALGQYDPETADSSQPANYRKAVRLTAQLASLVATYGRLQAGGGPIQPDPALGHAANFLYMLTGNRPNALSTHAFDVALVLHADHELNASTFAARVAAATLTDLYSAVVAAIGTLKGPLHGGANADVMRLLIDIGPDAPPERIDDAIRGKLREEDQDPRVRPPRLHDRGSARDTPPAHVQGARRAGGEHAVVRDVAADRAAGEGGEEAEPQRRFLFGVHLLHARDPDRSVHADLRRQPRRRDGRPIASSSTRTTASSVLARTTSDPAYPQTVRPMENR